MLLKKRKVIIIWDTRDIPNGFYIYEFDMNKGQVANGKIVIQH